MDYHDPLVSLRRDRENVLILIFYECDAVVADGFLHCLELFFPEDGVRGLRLGNKVFFCLFVQSQMGFEPQNAGQGLCHALLADDAVFVSLEHGGEVFVRIVEEEEHVAPCVDGAREHLGAGHAVCHSNHMGGVGDHHSVEAQPVSQESGHDLRA